MLKLYRNEQMHLEQDSNKVKIKQSKGQNQRLIIEKNKPTRTNKEEIAEAPDTD